MHPIFCLLLNAMSLMVRQIFPLKIIVLCQNDDFTFLFMFYFIFNTKAQIEFKKIDLSMNCNDTMLFLVQN